VLVVKTLSGYIKEFQKGTPIP